MWNDREADIDLIGHKSMADTIVKLAVETELSPLTIGIHGDWGAGKSSMLKFIASELAKDKETLCLTFNGWLFEGYDDAKSALMETIITELQNAQPANRKLKNKAKKLLKRVNWLRFARHAAGLAWTFATGIPDPSLVDGVIKAIKKTAENPRETISSEKAKELYASFKSSIKAEESVTVPQEIHAFRKEFEELLETSKIKRLIVLVDDLDRCLPHTSIETLEAIRLFLFVPRTVFVLAADERMIAYAVSKHFPDLPVSVGQSDYTKNYLEKLVQIPFRIPPLSKRETHTYITLLLIGYAVKGNEGLFDSIYECAEEIFQHPDKDNRLDGEFIQSKLKEIPEQIKAPLLLAGRISNVLAECLHGNPRLVKRFLNTMMLRLRIATAYGIEKSVDGNTLAKLMLLERFDEQMYRTIIELATKSANGDIKELKEFEDWVRNGAKEEEKPEGADEWSKDDWFIGWSKIDPIIGAVDLRPYVYVSREKTSGFLDYTGLEQDLDEIVKKLSAANPLVISGLREALLGLTAKDAKRVFEALADKVRYSKSFSTKPSEIDGLCGFCKFREEFQDDLIMLLENLPLKDIGVWVLSGIKSSLTQASSQVRYEKLFNGYKNQTVNGQLKKAAEGLANLQ